MRLTIEKLIYGGDGLARLSPDEHGRGKAVFLPFVLPGEEVEAALIEEKRGFGRARADEVLQASPQRVSPRCPYFQRCGGCHYQHTSYENQLEIKSTILRENLRRIAKVELETQLQVHASPSWNYRNRTRLKIKTAPEFALGYFRLASHELLAVETCPISSPLLNRAIAALWQLGRSGQFPDDIHEIELFANAEDRLLLVEAHGSGVAAAAARPGWVDALRRDMPEIAGVVLFEQSSGRHAMPSELRPQVVVGNGEIAYGTLRGPYRVSAGAFFQVNRHLTDHLVDLVTLGQSGQTALDLYAGGGLFSSALARNFRQVVAVEVSEISHSDLVYNSPANVNVVRAHTEPYLKKVAGKLRPDLVVVDPPRGGLGESVVRALAASGAPRITYVSCDPATVSRDLGGLLGSGYRIEQAHLIDLFPQTYHIESVFKLTKSGGALS